MSEIEVPLEQTQQDLEHAAHHASHGGGAQQSWITWSALLSAGLAVLAAIAALRAGSEVNEAMLKQMRASDSWAFFQAKGIKANGLETRIQILTALGKEVPPELKTKIAEYGTEQKELSEKAKTLDEESEGHFHRHEVFASSVTFYQIAIAITAIAVLSRRRKFLFVAAAFGCVGVGYLVKAFLTSGHHG